MAKTRKKTSSRSKTSSRAKPRRKSSRSRSRGRNKKRATWLRLAFTAVVIGLIAIWIWDPMLYINSSDFFQRYYRYLTTSEDTTFASTPPQSVLRTNENYGAEIEKLARQFDLSPEFLKALIVLECSGLKNIKPRFERHVYHRLENVRSGKMTRFENITPSHIRDATDDALKNMARSWGPFQIMGYKCILLNIQLKDLRGDNSLYWAVKWIDLTYGDYIRKGKYKDAFHIHNTGRPYPSSGPPKTYDPRYVSNGLMYMKFFKDLKRQNSTSFLSGSR